MPSMQVIIIVLYLLPVLFLIDKNKLKIALLAFVFLMFPIFLEIYTGGFEYFKIISFIFWIILIVLLRHFRCIFNKCKFLNY
jgi:hypothetical protein